MIFPRRTREGAFVIVDHANRYRGQVELIDRDDFKSHEHRKLHNAWADKLRWGGYRPQRTFRNCGCRLRLKAIAPFKRVAVGHVPKIERGPALSHFQVVTKGRPLAWRTLVRELWKFGLRPLEENRFDTVDGFR